MKKRTILVQCGLLGLLAGAVILLSVGSGHGQPAVPPAPAPTTANAGAGGEGVCHRGSGGRAGRGARRPAPTAATVPAGQTPASAAPGTGTGTVAPTEAAKTEAAPAAPMVEITHVPGAEDGLRLNFRGVPLDAVLDQTEQGGRVC